MTVEGLIEKLTQAPPEAWWDNTVSAPLVKCVVAEVDKLGPEAQISFVLLGLESLRQETQPPTGGPLNDALSLLLRRKLTFEEPQLLRMLEVIASGRRVYPFKGVLKAAESVPPSPALAEALRKLRAAIDPYWLGGTLAGELVRRIDKLLEAQPEAMSAPAPPPLPSHGPWSRAVLAAVSSLPDAAAWTAILRHAEALKGTTASQKWLDEASARIAAVGRPRFLEVASGWLALGPNAGQTRLPLSSEESELVKGFLWFFAGLDSTEAARRLARFAEQCLTKIPSVGAVSQKAGNACVMVLSRMAGDEPLAQLARLAQRIRYDVAQRLIEQALQEAAAARGLSRQELEERTVPTLDLAADGKRVERIGESFAVLRVDGSKALLEWQDAAGKPLKAAPKAAREAAAEFKEVTETAQQAQMLLKAHLLRIERLLLSQRTIPFEIWRHHYAEHPLLGSLTRSLLWHTGTAPARWTGARFVDWAGQPVEQADSVRLWHPITSDVQTVINWRCRLEDDGVHQPFKQAHREVYLLTDAERASGDQSLRFAGHVLKQHQFQALCESRGWQFRLLGPWDGHNNPTLALPEYGLVADLLVDFPHEETLSHGGVYIYVTTGALCFRDTAGRPRRLADVPATALSEVLRDVDLFVGVASIGNDPTFGQENQHHALREYWYRYSDLELSESGLSRRETLQRLLPKLTIAGRCSIQGRYLQVHGQRATYRIHLGSGNVIREPGSVYLCIVQGHGAAVRGRDITAGLRLPFEPDDMLNLILSKAFLLANDDRITDPAILSQLPPPPGT